MRLSTDYYPGYVDFYCWNCDEGYTDVQIEGIYDDDVRVECPVCSEPTYVRVIED